MRRSSTCEDADSSATSGKAGGILGCNSASDNTSGKCRIENLDVGLCDTEYVPVNLERKFEKALDTVTLKVSMDSA